MTQPSLSSSLSSLTSSLTLLNSTLSHLERSTRDFPRLSRVLSQHKPYTLISEPELLSAQRSILSSLIPEFEGLVRRVEGEVARMGRRERQLHHQRTLVAGRIEGARRGLDKRRGAPVQAAKGQGNKEKMEKLRDKRRRLEFAVNRLQMQVEQKKREMRKSNVYGMMGQGLGGGGSRGAYGEDEDVEMS